MLKRVLLLPLLGVAIAPLSVGSAPNAPPPAVRVGSGARRGAFTCDFNIPKSYPAGQIGPMIERDRMYMSARPGFQRKIIPVRPDAQGDLLTGGRYLFRTYEDAVRYSRWVDQDFVLENTSFFRRPFFSEIDCRPWEVVHSAELRDPWKDAVVLRTERFAVPGGDARGALDAAWPALLAEARKRQLTEVQLLYNEADHRVSLVYTRGRVGERTRELDNASLSAIESPSPLGASLAALAGWSRTFDRSEWALTVWHPFAAGDHGQPALWPNSPPLPGPSCGDGLCEPSRGESGQTCPADCPGTCGDGRCQPGESTRSCPSDCRL